MAPIEVTPEVLAHRILRLLPLDGTPVLNRVMRVMLSRQLEIQIEPDLYFAARDLLFQNGKIGRSRGQSGQIFLAALNGSQAGAAEPALPAEPWPEARLMQPLRMYLDGRFDADSIFQPMASALCKIPPQWVRREGVGLDPISSWPAPCGSNFCPARKSTCMVSN